MSSYCIAGCSRWLQCSSGMSFRTLSEEMRFQVIEKRMMHAACSVQQALTQPGECSTLRGASRSERSAEARSPRWLCDTSRCRIQELMHASCCPSDGTMAQSSCRDRSRCPACRRLARTTEPCRLLGNVTNAAFKGRADCCSTRSSRSGCSASSASRSLTEHGEVQDCASSTSVAS